MIIRKNLKANYTKIPNTPDDYLNDPTITAKSKGILTQLLCKVDTWTLNVNYLVKTNKDGASAIRSAINELIGSGYIHREVIRDKSGRIRGTKHIIFDHRVSPAEATHTTAGVSSGMEQPVIQNENPEPDTTSQVKTQIRDTAASGTNHIQEIHIRKIAPVVKNKGNNKLGVTTTTTPDQSKQGPEKNTSPLPSSSYPATEDINSLLDLIPEQHRKPTVEQLIRQVLGNHTTLEVKEAIVYASDKVKGGWLQYRAYLDKSLQNGWAVGYLDAKEQGNPAEPWVPALSPRGRYPNGTVTGSARMDSNYQAAAEFLARRGAQ